MDMKLGHSLEKHQDPQKEPSLQTTNLSNVAQQVTDKIGAQLDEFSKDIQSLLKEAFVKEAFALGGEKAHIDFIEKNQQNGCFMLRIDQYLNAEINPKTLPGLQEMHGAGVMKQSELNQPFPIFKNTISLEGLNQQVEHKIGGLLDHYPAVEQTALSQALTHACFNVTKSEESMINNIIIRPDNGYLEAKVDDWFYASIDPTTVLKDSAGAEILPTEPAQTVSAPISEPELSTTVTVEKGDTIERIARDVAKERYGEQTTQNDVIRTTAQIIEANGITKQSDLNRLQIGQVLTIPDEHASFEKGAQVYGKNIDHHEARMAAERAAAEQARLAEIAKQQEAEQKQVAAIKNHFAQVNEIFKNAVNKSSTQTQPLPAATSLSNESSSTNKGILGLNRDQVDRDIANRLANNESIAWGATKYAAKHTFYKVWNTLSGGFVESHDSRIVARDQGKITNAQFWTATGVSATASIGTAVLAKGVANGPVPFNLPVNAVTQTLTTGAVGMGLETVNQTADKLNYHITGGATGKEHLSAKNIVISGVTSTVADIGVNNKYVQTKLSPKITPSGVSLNYTPGQVKPNGVSTFVEDATGYVIENSANGALKK